MRMKILILNTSERTGGAAIAANRLMHALNKSGHEAKMLVRDKQTDDENVVSINTSWLNKKINFVRFAWERWVIFVHNRFSKKNLFAVSIANTGADISKHPLVNEADIIHVHWINQGFLSLKSIKQLTKLGKPIVWTMHDMWCFTRACHYAGDCRKYETQCDHCEMLRCNNVDKSTLSTAAINFVGCSRWIADKARESQLLRNANLTNIPNPIDVSVFKPFDKARTRQKFNLPIDKQLILFAAAKLSDERKGIKYLVEACHRLNARQTELVFLGGKIDEQLVQEIPLNKHILGYLRTPEDIAMAYTTCDVFVTPSLEDNLPNTIMESMACGTPCVGFNVGGIPEMIDHRKNGYVAQYKDAKDLATGIEWVLDNAEKLHLAEACIEKVKANYAEAIVAEKYISLYSDLLMKQ
jgi:glycosyltransferase involved in cell wall biosynthesis